MKFISRVLWSSLDIRGWWTAVYVFREKNGCKDNKDLTVDVILWFRRKLLEKFLDRFKKFSVILVFGD